MNTQNRQQEQLDLALSRESAHTIHNAGIKTYINDLMKGYPLAATVINRLNQRIGLEISHQPGHALLLAAWASEKDDMDKLRNQYSINDPLYLYKMLHCLLTPVRWALAYDIRVKGQPWSLADYFVWQDWRDNHPGEICVSERKEQVTEVSRVAIEKSILGTHFLTKIEATKAWPNFNVAI